MRDRLRFFVLKCERDDNYDRNSTLCFALLVARLGIASLIILIGFRRGCQLVDSVIGIERKSAYNRRGNSEGWTDREREPVP
jgi:hypothetical protein